MEVKNLIPFTVILFGFFCGNPSYAGATQNPLYLKAPMVQWNGNQLSGELINVPVSNLLKDLIRSKNFDCHVSGQLQGSISIRFENLTIEEIIHKVMRSNNYNYTILSAQGSTDIEKLTIYEGDSIVSFSKIPVSDSPPRTTKKAERIKPSTPDFSKRIPNVQPSKSDEQYARQVEELDGEIKGFLDDMLETKKISKEEYEKTLSEIKTHERTN